MMNRAILDNHKYLCDERWIKVKELKDEGKTEEANNLVEKIKKSYGQDKERGIKKNC